MRFFCLVVRPWDWTENRESHDKIVRLERSACLVFNIALHNIIDEKLEFSVDDWRNSSKPLWWQRINLQINMGVSSFIYDLDNKQGILHSISGSQKSWNDRMTKALKSCTLTCICTWIGHTLFFVYKNIIFSGPGWISLFSCWFEAENILMNILRLIIYHVSFYSLVHAFCAAYLTFV